jgi:hypothetical protein
MTADSLLTSQRQHLASLVLAIQRCAYFLHASDAHIPWPIDGSGLESRKKDLGLFEALAAINERFAKLQDTMGSGMRHSIVLSGEQADSFLKVLALFEKWGVVESAEQWQLARTARNLAAHDYETDYSAVAEHFNTLHALTPVLLATARRFVVYCRETLRVEAAQPDFAEDFDRITRPD